MAEDLHDATRIADPLSAANEAGAAAIRGATLRVVGYGVTIALSVVSAALLFRHLGVAEGGRYVTILSLIALVAGLTDGGLTAIGVREFATGTVESRRAALQALLGMRIAMTVLGVAGAVAFAAIAGYSGTLVAGTAVAGAGMFLQTLQTAATVPLQAELRFGWVTAADVLRQAVTVLAVIALVLAGAGLLAFLAIGIPAALASLVLTVSAVRQRDALVPAFRRSAWAGLIGDALPYAVTSAVGAVYFRLAIIILSLVASERATGLFGASFRIVDVLIVVPQLIVGAVFPIFARSAADDRDRMRYAVGRTFDGTLIAGLWTAAALVVGAGFAIEVVAGPDFAAAAGVLQIQAFALLFAFVNAVVGYTLLSLGMYRALLAIATAALLTVAALTPVLGDSGGAKGGAVVTVIGEGVVATGGLLVLWRSHRDLLPSLPRTLLIVLAAVPAFAVAALDLPDVPAVLLATVLYAAGLALTRSIPEELLVEVRRVLRRRP